MRAILLGSNSDIAKGLTPLLEADGWIVSGWARWSIPYDFWDLIIVCIGTVAPVGVWHQQPTWDESIITNLVTPVWLLRALWEYHRTGASICFLAGSNPNKVHLNYSAYAVAKMALLKVCEHFDAETPDAKFFALNPGYVDTKIHKPSIEAGIDLSGRVSTPMERIYGALKWAIAQPKDVIGGRNLCVSDPWDANYDFAAYLKANPSMFKLRRVE